MPLLKLGLLLVGLLPSLLLADYVERQDVQAFATTFAKEQNLKVDEILAVLAQAKKQQSIIDAISRPAERVLTWADYRKIFIEQKRLDKGIIFWQQYKDVLAKVEAKYQVPAQMIVAIIGVETRYGAITGNYRVLDALMTLGFDYPKRGKFFRKQLKELLLLAKEQNLPVDELKGSYAGAMGYGQFIPSSYRAYAVDYDGDKVADIWNNPEDALASVANYFSEHKWRYGDLVAVKLVPQKIDSALFSSSLKPNHKVKTLRAKGVRIPAEIADTATVSLMQLEGVNGTEHWLGFHNFYVITRYNHSSMYALAAWQLSQLLEKTVHGL